VDITCQSNQKNSTKSTKLDTKQECTNINPSIDKSEHGKKKKLCSDPKSRIVQHPGPLMERELAEQDILLRTRLGSTSIGKSTPIAYTAPPSKIHFKSERRQPQHEWEKQGSLKRERGAYKGRIGCL